MSPSSTADVEKRAARRRELDAKLDTVLVDIAYVDEAWPSIVEMAIPGSAKRWSQRPARTAAAKWARTHPELVPEQSGVPRAAPADVAVLDILHGYADVAACIARDVIISRGLAKTPHGTAKAPRRVWFPDHSPSRDPRPWLHAIEFLLPHAHTMTVETDRPIVDRVSRNLHRLVPAVEHAMGDVRDGQVLAGICPWCDGRTAEGRGALTMKVHFDEPRDLDEPLSVEDDDEEAPAPVIVCHGLNCVPPVTAFRDLWPGTPCPAWPIREWDWLAKQLKPIEPNNRRTA